MKERRKDISRNKQKKIRERGEENWMILGEWMKESKKEGEDIRKKKKEKESQSAKREKERKGNN